jgi:hypothetical protein
MQTFLSGNSNGPETATGRRQNQHAAHDWSKRVKTGTGGLGDLSDASMLAGKLSAAATRCRDHRQELSLLIVEPNVYDVLSAPHAELASHQARRALGSACSSLDQEKIALVSLSKHRTAAIISDCERRDALAAAQNAIAEVAKLAAAHVEESGSHATTLSIGVATASVVSKNFDPIRMIESAARCLSAARACGISAVKSIEV